jgi:hypothetical protein
MDLNEEIAKVAYELFEKDGRQNGKDKEHWFEAEAIVKSRRAAEEKKAETRKEAPVSTRQRTSTAKVQPAPKKKAETPKSATLPASGRAGKPAVKEKTK